MCFVGILKEPRGEGNEKEQILLSKHSRHSSPSYFFIYFSPPLKVIHNKRKEECIREVLVISACCASCAIACNILVAVPRK